MAKCEMAAGLSVFFEPVGLRKRTRSCAETWGILPIRAPQLSILQREPVSRSEEWTAHASEEIGDAVEWLLGYCASRLRWFSHYLSNRAKWDYRPGTRRPRLLSQQRSRTYKILIQQRSSKVFPENTSVFWSRLCLVKLYLCINKQIMFADPAPKIPALMCANADDSGSGAPVPPISHPAHRNNRYRYQAIDRVQMGIESAEDTQVVHVAIDRYRTLELLTDRGPKENQELCSRMLKKVSQRGRREHGD